MMTARMAIPFTDLHAGKVRSWVVRISSFYIPSSS